MEELSGECARNNATYLRFVDAYNHRDIDTLVSCYASDGIHHEPFTTPPDFVGHDAIRRFNNQLLASFPDEVVQPRRILVEGRWVFAVCRCTGTHAGEFLGVPATGRRFDVEERVLVAFDEAGLIKNSWVFVDADDIIRQLTTSS
jgi:steroid delta-isomerase-like uncharacterized protein